MDNTVYQYAYRCLPLQIANSNGWVMECPSDIIVSWDGGDHKSCLQIHYAIDEWDFASSSFGYGILTLHSGYLFKTPDEEPRYDMMVTGIPNYWYDFMVPLTGIVETFWNPATATMNWKLLRPGFFEIKAGQPLIFITPIPHEVPKWAPEIVPVDQNADVSRDYHTWAKRRRATNDALDRAFMTGQEVGGINPADPSTHWEKKYFQGMDEKGNKVAGHQTKRRFAEFKCLSFTKSSDQPRIALDVPDVMPKKENS